MKKLVSIALALVLVMGLSACGDVDAGIGDVNKTKWFDFTVNSMEAVDTYKEVDAEEGKQFLVANVTVKNTWSEKDTIPMTSQDFHVLVDEDETRIAPEEDWDASMMVFKAFYLEPDQEVTADVVFYISDTAGKVSFVYEEMDEADKVYDSFAIEYQLPASTDEPTEPTDEPTEPTDEPTEPTDEPTEPTDEPTEPTDEPTEPTDEPTEPTDEPTEPTDEPTEPAEG